MAHQNELYYQPSLLYSSVTIDKTFLAELTSLYKAGSRQIATILLAIDVRPMELLAGL